MSTEQSPSAEKRTPMILLASFLIVLLTIGSYLVWNYSNNHQKSIDELSKLLGVGFTFLIALATLAVSIFNAFRTLAIERAKIDFTKELELFKKQITSDVEFIKGKFAMDRTALQEIAGASISAYYALCYFENELYSKDDLKSACKNLLSSLKYLPLLEKEEAEHLTNYTQQVIYIKELYDTILIDSSITKDERQKLHELWKTNGGAVSAAYEKLGAMLANKHHIPVA